MSTTSEKRQAAREALDAHDALTASYATEPELYPDGCPIDVPAWLAWKETKQDPAYARWEKAMDELAMALDTPDISLHPFNFRPMCAEILEGDES
jgi:hypothetical protein